MNLFKKKNVEMYVICKFAYDVLKNVCLYTNFHLFLDK